VSDPVLVERTGALATVVLNDPDRRNALSFAMLEAISAAFSEIEADPAIRVVVLTHNGPVFCAGANLKEALEFGMERSAGLVLGMLRQIVALSKPVVVRLAGPVRAGGLGIVGAADVVIASDDITFAFSEARIGVAPAIITLTILPRMTPRQSHRWCMSGETFTAAQAADAGLISQAVPAGELDATVAAVTGELLLASPQGLAETKRILGRPMLAAIDELGPGIAQRSAEMFATPEAKEGMAAFLERRKPSWQT
jgi:enoyl-CoA hydratase/carnithine racemase